MGLIYGQPYPHTSTICWGPAFLTSITCRDRHRLSIWSRSGRCHADIGQIHGWIRCNFQVHSFSCASTRVWGAVADLGRQQCFHGHWQSYSDRLSPNGLVSMGSVAISSTHPSTTGPDSLEVILPLAGLGASRSLYIRDQGIRRRVARKISIEEL